MPARLTVDWPTGVHRRWSHFDGVCHFAWYSERTRW